MTKLYSRLSSVKNKAVLQVLQKIMRQKVEDCDEKIQSYQEIIYGNNIGRLLISPSARYTFLTKQRLLPLQILLSAADSLLLIIATLQKYERLLLKKIDSTPVQSLSDHSVPMALAEVRYLLHDLLKEAAVLQGVLAFRLQRWYQGQEEMQFVAKKRYAYANECQQCLLALFSTTSRLQRKIKPYAAIAIKEKNASVDEHLSEILNRLQQKASAHFNVMQIPFINKQGQFELATLNTKRITHLVAQSRSYWKSSRYRATLTLLYIQHEREKDLQNENLHDKFVNVQTMQKQVASLRSNLHWLFHFKTRRLYQAFSQTLCHEQENLALFALRDNLFSLDTKLVKKSSALLGFAYLPLHLQELWQQLCYICCTPNACSDGRLDSVVSRLVQALSLSAEQYASLMRDIVSQFILPVVNSASHVAFPLVYKYMPRDAYDIQAPKIADITQFLEAESGWYDALYAKKHLAFLISGRQQPCAKSQRQSETFIANYFMECLLVQKQSKVSWQRLLDYANYFNLSNTYIDLIHAAQFWHNAADESTNIGMTIMQKLDVNNLNTLDLPQWLQYLQQLKFIINVVNPFLHQKQHPYFQMLKAFVKQLAQQLCMVAKQKNLFNLDLQKVCLFFYEHPIVTDIKLKTSLKEVVSSQPSEYPILSEQKESGENNFNLTILKSLCKAIKSMVSGCLVAKSDLKINLPNLNRQAWTSLMALDQNHASLQSYFCMLKQQLCTLSVSPFLSAKSQRYCKVVLAFFSDRPKLEKLNMIEQLLRMQRESLSFAFFAPKNENSPKKNKEAADAKQFSTTH